MGEKSALWASVRMFLRRWLIDYIIIQGAITVFMDSKPLIRMAT